MNLANTGFDMALVWYYTITLFGERVFVVDLYALSYAITSVQGTTTRLNDLCGVSSSDR